MSNRVYVAGTAILRGANPIPAAAAGGEPDENDSQRGSTHLSVNVLVGGQARRGVRQRGSVDGLIITGDRQRAVDYGAAHGAQAMTTPGDTSMASKDEVEKLMKGGSARVRR